MTAHGRPRARDLGIEIGSFATGKLNAIVDVPDVRVGHTTLHSDDNAVHTGVTAILPHGENLYTDKVCAAVHVINGHGKSTGFPQVEELGAIETPILLTNTLNVWSAADAMIDYLAEKNPDARTFNPIVGECNDGHTNDIVGRHVTREHVMEALKTASRNNIDEGCVGAGTGMHGFGWKGGIGTASRVTATDEGKFTVGAMVLTNTGQSSQLRIDGVPFGQDVVPDYVRDRAGEDGQGSIMLVVGTDLPVTARQLGRMARRATFGLARTGAKAEHGSGDFVIAFSNGTRFDGQGKPGRGFDRLVADSDLSTFFEMTIEAIEEAIVNALLRAETTFRPDGSELTALPIEDLKRVMANYGYRKDSA